MNLSLRFLTRPDSRLASSSPRGRASADAFASARRRASSLPKDLRSEKNPLHQAVSNECRLTTAATASNVSEVHSERWLEAPGSCRGSPTVPQRTPKRSSGPLEVVARRVRNHRISGELGRWRRRVAQRVGTSLRPCAGFRVPIRGVGSGAVPASDLSARALVAHRGGGVAVQSEARYSCSEVSVSLARDAVKGWGREQDQSTFVHLVAPATPGATARSRESSLPTTWGLDKSSHETACHALGFLHTTLISERFQHIAEGGLAVGCKDDSVESQERQRWRPAPGSSSWQRVVENREQILSGAFDTLKM